jgi:hypothetical protein
VIDTHHPVVNWLLRSGEPAIEYQTLTGILGQSPDEAATRSARARFISGLLKALSVLTAFSDHPPAGH